MFAWSRMWLAMGEGYEALSITNAPLEQSTASELAGSYQFGPDFYVPGAVMQIKAREGGLAVEGDPPGGLLPVSDSEFIHRQHWFRVSFLRDESGTVTRMKYDRFEARKKTEK